MTITQLNIFSIFLADVLRLYFYFHFLTLCKECTSKSCQFYLWHVIRIKSLLPTFTAMLVKSSINLSQGYDNELNRFSFSPFVFLSPVLNVTSRTRLEDIRHVTALFKDSLRMKVTSFSHLRARAAETSRVIAVIFSRVLLPFTPSDYSALCEKTAPFTFLSYSALQSRSSLLTSAALPQIPPPEYGCL